jgi:hypothetical protein
LPKQTPAADLVPLLEAHETHGQLCDGRMLIAFSCTGINMSILSRRGRKAVAARFAELLNGLKHTDRVTLQFQVLGDPLRAEEWLPAHMAQFRPPPGMEGYKEIYGDWARGEMAGRFVPDLRYYVIVAMPGAPKPGLALQRALAAHRVMARDNELHLRARSALQRVAAEVRQGLKRMGITATPLGSYELRELVHRCVNPHLSVRTAAPGAAPQQTTPVAADRIAERLRSRAADPAAHNRSLREQLARTMLVPRHSYIRHDWAYERTLAVRELPDATESGWLSRLIAAGIPIRFALHVATVDAGRDKAWLRLGLRQRHNLVREARRKDESPDIELEESRDQHEVVLRDYATNNLRRFRCQMLVTVRGRDTDELASNVREVAAALGEGDGADVDYCDLLQDLAWQATLPLATTALPRMWFPITTANLADTLPFIHHRAGTPGGPLLGFSEPAHEAVQLDMDDPGLLSKTIVVTGKKGSGKTQLVQAFALALVAMGSKAIVFDRSGDRSGIGHWEHLAAAIPGGEHHRVALDGALRVNPWQLPHGATSPSPEKLDNLLATHALMLGGLTDEERSILEAGFRAVYAEQGTPYERHLHDWVSSQDTPEHRALARRLGRYVGAGMYAGLIDGPTTVAADAPLEVFNFKGLGDGLVPLVMQLLIEHVWEVVSERNKAQHRPTLVVMDEGWSLLNNPASAAFVSEITRTDRHSNVITVNMSQKLEDYTGPLGQSVVDLASVEILLKQPEGQMDLAQEIFKLSDDERERVSNLDTIRRVGAGAYLHSDGGAERGFLNITFPKEVYWLTTSEPREQQLRRRFVEHYGGDVWLAVRELARTDGELPPEGAERPALAVV